MPKSKRPDGYHSWQSMIQRCERTGHPDFHNYGGRGITVCQQWRHDFRTFMADMGARPSKAHSIERRDTNGHYEPSNCCWATAKQQQNNRRNNRLLTFRGRTATLAQWAEDIGVSVFALYQRLARGTMTLEQALTFEPRLVEYQGQRRTVTEWAAVTGVDAGTIGRRLERGWSIEKALTAAVRPWGRPRGKKKSGVAGAPS